MKNVFLFPGYGAQYVGMGKEFYDHYRCVQELFEEASNCLSINFVKLCFASSEKELSKPSNAYLALFVVQTSLYHVLLEHGIEPSLITGWGVGLSSTYHAAGVINFPDVLYLLGKYLAFLDELLHGHYAATMRLKGITREQLEQLMGQYNLNTSMVLAIVKTEYEHIVVGAAQTITYLRTLVQPRGVKCSDEPIAYALHLLCRHEMVKRMNEYLVKIDCKVPRYPLLNHEGQFIAVGQPLSKEMLTRFMYEPIDIPRIVKHVILSQVLVQIGPSFLPLSIIKRYLPQTQIKCILKCKDLKGLCHEYF